MKRLKNRKIRRIHRKTKRVKRGKIKAHSIETQVTGKLIDEELEASCESPPNGLTVYRSYRLYRKSHKYPRLFMGGKLPPEVDKDEAVPCNFGPPTIRRTDD